MALAVTVIERIRLPDVRRLDKMPSLPAWVASRIASLTDDDQKDQKSGKYRNVPTLPCSLLLSEIERDELSSHVRSLDALCAATPSESADEEAAMLNAIAAMMLVLPSMQQTDIGAHARGEAFLMALEDVPTWAVQAAIRCWYRGEAGNDDRGQRFDTHWCPAPGDLRKIALVQKWRVKNRAEELRRLLGAEARVEFTDEHRAAQSARFDDILRKFGISPVGKDGSGETSAIPMRGSTVGRDQEQARP